MRYSHVFPADSLRRYLLGRLEEEETERVDRQILTEEQALEALEEAEDDLIEDYLDGSLDPEERAAFEDHFLAASAHRQSLDCARIVREHMLREPAPVRHFRPRPTLVWIGAVAALLLIGLWLALPSVPHPEPAQQAATPTTVPAAVLPPVPEATPSAAVPSSPPAPVRVAATLVVSRQMAEGDGDPTLVRWRRGEAEVRIDIAFLEGAVTYRRLAARLLREGRVVHEWKGLRPQTDVTLVLPTQQLTPGAYTLVLSGSDPEGQSVDIDRWPLVLQAS